jgi:iron(III) transport system ATP-binding protein
MGQTVLEFRDVVKRFGTVAAVDKVSFWIQSGEIFTLLGPSGCGKTTTLRLIAGLDRSQREAWRWTITDGHTG